jgi:hypothetical protein
MRKRVLAILATAVLALTLGAAPAAAEDDCHSFLVNLAVAQYGSMKGYADTVFGGSVQDAQAAFRDFCGQ